MASGARVMKIERLLTSFEAYYAYILRSKGHFALRTRAVFICLTGPEACLQVSLLCTVLCNLLRCELLNEQPTMALASGALASSSQSRTHDH